MIIKKYPSVKTNFSARIINEEQQTFIDLVIQILSMKSEDKNTSVLEQQIDHLAYQLYDLTYEEVKIVAPAFSLSPEKYECLRINEQ
ncbi:MAG: hypothetical protein RMJ87_09935 [Cytophagales bacterium]|nr:hypothetical protein [Bernardetiaceae bacterium]MDW8205337.1 hypothetical protein [Cytophagales bacterium]